MKRIPFLKPKFPDISLIERDLEAIYRNGIYTNGGEFDKKFNKLIADYISEDTKVSVVGNATLGLIMAIRQLFIEGRRKVLIQSFTFSAGAQAILWSNHEPVFLDINLQDWQADVTQARSYLREHNTDVAGIIVCNTFGAPNKDIGEWEILAKEHNLPLIIDSAAGFGSDYQDGRKMGTRGDCEIFSFHATKPFGIGEGGAITSRNEEFISKMERMKNFSFDDKGESNFIGLNAKLPEISCAIGARVFEDYEKRLTIRRSILDKYKDRLTGNDLTFQLFDEISTVPFLSVLLTGGQREITNHLLGNGIEVRNYYNPPLHKQPLYSKYETISVMANTEMVCSRIISLPMYEDLSDPDLDMICAGIKETLNELASARAF